MEITSNNLEAIYQTDHNANKVALNINKTKYMIFTMRGKRIDADLPPILYTANEPNQ
jgi:hypothetical protein